jgi:hypothetical protein
MPKDPTKNIDRYKIKGGQLNEFDFQQSQEEFAAQQQQDGANLIPGTPPEAAKSRKSTTATKSTKATKGVKAGKLGKAAKSAKAKSAKVKKSGKTTKSAKATKPRKARKRVGTKGATAKKLAARKAAKK